MCAHMYAARDRLAAQKQNLVQGTLHLSFSYQIGISSRKSLSHTMTLFILHIYVLACTRCDHEITRNRDAETPVNNDIPFTGNYFEVLLSISYGP